MKRLLISFLIIFCASGILNAGRKALVIGNAAYGSKTLKNPVNDAGDLAIALQDLGFATTLINNADYAAMYRGIENFTEALDGKDEVIMYFSGHGVQISDTNYLMPVGERKLADRIDYDTYAISATWTLGKLAKAKVSVLILDACRDNPTLTRSMSLKKGLAKLEPESGSQYVIYATEKDTEAFDGEGRNSPFAASLLKHMKSPVQVGDDLMRLIRSDVRMATKGQQVPTAYGILDDPFYIAPLPTTNNRTAASNDTETTAQGVEGLVVELGKLKESRKQSELELNDLKEYLSTVVDPPKIPTTQGEMAFVEGGSFMMGSEDGEDNEKPVHQVTVSSFYIGKFEVTQKEWQEVMGEWDNINDNPSEYGSGDNNPIYSVSWYDAVEYCNKRSINEDLKPCYTIDKTKNDPNNNNEYDNLKWSVSVNWRANGYRLPTEAEWEYAARGGNKSNGFKYSGSNNISSVAWYEGNSGGQTHAVGTKEANELGIYDMCGNVWEWCWDWYDENYYTRSQSSDPIGPDSGSFYVVRGSAWFSYVAADPYRFTERGCGSFDGGPVGVRVVRAFR